MYNDQRKQTNFKRAEWNIKISEKKAKNRRAKGAKISEYRLRKLVKAFASNLNVKDAAEATGFSEPTVRNRFMQIRQRIHDHGIMRMNRPDTGEIPARFIFGPKHRGVPQRYAHLYEIELLHRIFFTKNAKSVRRFKASDENDMNEVRRLLRYNKLNDKYDIIEMLEGGESDDALKERRPFDMSDYRSTSTIIVNEKNLDPHEAFFTYIWALLKKHPL